MIGIQENSAKTATEITTKAQGQLTRLAMLLDIINQDFIIPCIKNVAKLAADFKQGEEEIYVNQDNGQETLVIDDEVRQADYKYTYSDRNMLNEKSVNADLVGNAIEKFSQVLPLDMAEIFTWYFEQKGVENPERFLNQEQLQYQKQMEAIQQKMQEQQVVQQILQTQTAQNMGQIGVQAGQDGQSPQAVQIPRKEEAEVVQEQQEDVIPTLLELAEKYNSDRKEENNG